MHKDFMISNLVKQKDLLEKLITHFEKKQRLDRHDHILYDKTTTQIEKNLRRLRIITEDFFESYAS